MNFSNEIVRTRDYWNELKTSVRNKLFSSQLFYTFTWCPFEIFEIAICTVAVHTHTHTHTACINASVQIVDRVPSIFTKCFIQKLNAEDRQQRKGKEEWEKGQRERERGMEKKYEGNKTKRFFTGKNLFTGNFYSPP